jgi:hypothetical protein
MENSSAIRSEGIGDWIWGSLERGEPIDERLTPFVSKFDRS